VAGAALAGLWERFKETFDQQVAVLESATMDALSDELDPEARERALREAHKLAGSLGTFGMPRGSEIAREVETWFGSGPGTEAADILRLSDAVVGLRQCIEAGPATRPPNVPQAAEAVGPCVLLVDNDPAVVEGLRREAALRALTLDAVDSVEGARQLLLSRRPEAVVVDLAGPEAHQTLELMRELQAMSPPVPVVVLTRARTFTDRVEAARLGGRGFLQKPIRPADALSAVVEVITNARAGDATVLAVDDDPVVLAAISALLKSAGRRVVTLDQPAHSGRPSRTRRRTWWCSTWTCRR